MISIDKFNKYINKCYARGFKAVHENDQASMAGSAISILVLLVVLMMAALLFGTIQGKTSEKIDGLNDANATASFNSIAATGWGSIDLFGMIPYVAVFIVLLGMLMGLTRDQ